MIRIRVHPVIAFGLMILIGGLILIGVLPGGPFGSPPTVPSVAVPTLPTTPGQPEETEQQELPDGVTLFTGDAPGEPRQLSVDANANVREGDVQVIFDGVNETDQGLQARMRVSSASEPGGPVNLYPGEQFEFGGYVFRVNEETNAWRLVLDVWTLT